MVLTLKWQDIAGMKRLENGLAKLDGPAKHLVLQRAVNHTGSKARTQVLRTLAKQTGLPYGVISKAVKSSRATGGYLNKSSGEVTVRTDAVLSYTMTATGGDISLRYFKARETKSGVTAAPFGKRELFPGAFMKGGRFPNRVTAKGLSGHVYRRTGSKRGPLKLLNSGVIIPAEMISGASAKVFTEVVERDLPDRTRHEIEVLAPGIFD